MNIQEINNRIRHIEDNETIDFTIAGGKTIPYQGWYWRDISEGSITLADNGEWVGFCENNKWSYPEVTVKGEQAATIIALLTKLAAKPTVDNAKELFDHLQTFKSSCAGGYDAYDDDADGEAS